MLVSGHKLHQDDGAPVAFRPSPNHSGRLVAPRFLVLHYTAGRDFEQSCAWLCSPKAKASAHVVVGRGGEVAQLVPFDARAWHAGASRYEHVEREGHRLTYEGLNQHSIGVELDNAGVLRRTAVGWSTYWGETVAGEDVVIGEHRLGGGLRGWHAFTEAQILAAYVICEALIDAYPSIEAVIGHDEIAVPVGRKLDPGPAWPMDTFRGWLFGRGEG